MTDLPPIPGLNPLLNPLPAKFHHLRETQIHAVMEILDAFNAGTKVVVLDAPVGSGKTIMAEVTRLMLKTHATYIAHNKDLQVQFARDFPYARVLWGRANYEPLYAHLYPNTTCADCTFQAKQTSCGLCVDKEECPYEKAKIEASRAPVAVLNMAYWLNESHHSKTFARPLTIIDEVDVLEGVLLEQVSVIVSARMAHNYNIHPPTRLTKEEDHAPWVEQVLSTLMPQLQRLRSGARHSSGALREFLRVDGLVQRLRGMAEDLAQGRQWIYTGGAGSHRRDGELIEFKPVELGRLGGRLWKGDRFLVMSGTVVSDTMLLEGLGYDGEHHLVKLDSRFHARNRQLVVQPTADMGKAMRTAATVPMLTARIRRIVDKHPDHSILCHTVSYQLSRDIARGLTVTGREIITHANGQDRPAALEKFRATPGAILLSPSMDRGIDLPDDLCRVQILTKVPYPNLGDRQVSARLYNTENGKVWYHVQVARSIMQMTGRAVRHENDWAVTYVVDSAFVRWYREWQRLLPKWFRVAVRVER